MKNLSIIPVILIAFGIYFLLAAFFMLLYNYSVPVIVGSINSSYDKKKNFKKLTYLEACVLLLFIGMVFGTSTVVVKQCY